MTHKANFRLYAACLILFMLAGCANPPDRQTPPAEPFLPPTRPPNSSPVPISTPTPAGPTNTPTAVESTPTLTCTNNLAFAADLTIPDGTVVKPGEQLEKRWQVRNSGTCNWDSRYRIVLTGGPAMGAAEEQALFPARSDTEAKIRMIFTAPDEPGSYQSAWQAVAPDGEFFGDPIFIDIIVEENPPAG